MRSEEEERERALLAELDAVYREIDTSFAGARCEASTECCRFGITGREPMVTTIEIAAIERALARRGGALGAGRRALPLIASGSAVGGAPQRACDLLHRDGRCAVYAARPLGCRTFFCDRADVPHRPDRAMLTGIVRRVQEIAARHRPSGDVPVRLSSRTKSSGRAERTNGRGREG